MLYKIIPQEKGFIVRNHLDLDEVFRINRWMTYYSIEHEITEE